MSLRLWKKEFYPKPANKTIEREAVAHSLRKWEGLTKENLKRHNIVKKFWHIEDRAGIGLIIGQDSCALCHHYYDPDAEHGCEKCPLAIVRKNVACDRITPSDGPWTPYADFTCNDNPAPMIAWLKKALAWEKRRARRR